MNLKETAAAAKAEGLTYGEYVTKHSPPVTVIVPKDLKKAADVAEEKAAEPSPPEQGLTRSCKYCGKEFPLKSSKSLKLYCSDACYKQYVNDKAKKKESRAA